MFKYLFCVWIIVAFGILCENMDELFPTYNTTPRRKPPQRVLSPFCTSPSQLQEVTLDQTKLSPGRGRSVKEYDEQLTALKKENFNLKLRIYFLEERMGPTYHVKGQDNWVRKDIDYKVELQTLRKEIEEKHELLCQAVKAMELEETEHKKVLSKKDIQIAELNERLEATLKEQNALTEMNDMLVQKQNKLMEDSSIIYTEAFNLQDINSKTKLEIEQLQDQINDLETQLAEERQHSAILQCSLEDTECLQEKCHNFELELNEKNCQIEKLCLDLEDKSNTISQLNLKIRMLDDEINSKTNEIEIKDKELSRHEQIIKKQIYEIEEYKQRLSCGSILNDKDQRQIGNLKSAIVSRDNTIAELEKKLEKCKSVIINLEAKQERIANENKKHQDEINIMKSQCKSKSINETSLSLSPGRMDQRSVSSTSDYFEDDIHNLKETIKKKEEQYKVACNMIQQFLLKRKGLEKEIHDLQVHNEKKDIKIVELQKELKRIGYGNKSPVNNQPECENSADDSVTGVHLEETNVKEASVEMEKQVQELLKTLQTKEEQFETAASTIKNKDNRITELERELTQLNQELMEARIQLADIQSFRNEDRPPSFWTKETEEKDKKIEKLESEVRKHTINLQGIVNTELWEKNREIEKLQSKFTDKVRIKDEQITKLEKELISKSMHLEYLKDQIGGCTKQSEQIQIPEDVNVLKEQLKMSTETSKYLQKTVEELTQQLHNIPERESDSKLLQIKALNVKLQQDLEKSEKCRVEMGNVCVLLTTRLDELATFLDSLLKHKSVLGLLGIKQQSAIKHAIDQSLDLSKTFNMSLMGEDKSLAQLSSLSGFLNATQNSVNMSMFDSYFEDETKRASLIATNALHGNNVSLTYNSHLSRQKGEENNKDVINEQSEIITVLRNQIETLKKEIEIRDMELANHNMISDQEKSLKNDNDLVEVLMDLHSKSPHKKGVEVMSPNKIYQSLIDSKSPLKNHLNDNQSESETWSEPDRDVSQARIGLDAESLKSTSLNRSRSLKHSSGDGLSTESTEEEFSHSQNKTPPKRNSGSVDPRILNMLQENIKILENQLKEKDNEILQFQCRAMDNDNKVKESQIKLYAELEILRKQKTEIENVLKESEKIIVTLENKHLEMETKMIEIIEEKEKYIRDVKEKEKQIESLNEKTQSLENTVESHENEIQNKLKENDLKWMEKLQKMEKEAEVRLNEIRETTNQLKEKYETEWIQKEEYNKHYTKLQMVYTELENLKGLLKDAEIKGKKLEHSEVELQKKLEDTEKDNREKIMALKRELNEYALRTSQAVLERTKASNEKLKIEQELRRLETREQERSQEFTEKERQFIIFKNSIQKQLSQIELQKTHLQVKVTELETNNVELHNRIMRLQSGDTSPWSKSTPTSPIKITDTFLNIQQLGKHSLGNRFSLNRQRSDMSEYASEDVLTDNEGVFNKSAPEAFNWFNNGNNVADASEARNIANSSPDLGIESDPGRFSSLETNVSRPLLHTLELTASMNNLLSKSHNDNVGQYCNVPAHKTLAKQNEELQKTVSKLETRIEKTMTQLSIINKNKKQVEKAVCKQIHKTSIVLRKARANLDSGSENEVLRK